MVFENQKHPAFDKYAVDYDGGMGNPLKKALGKDSNAYLTVKVNWLLKKLESRRLFLDRFPQRLRLLDFGCGRGDFLIILRKRKLDCQLVGCDVSEGMLNIAREAIEDPETLLLTQKDPHKIQMESNSFDLITALAVFHHIDPPIRPSVIIELKRVLRPGGCLILFEHNPLNPVTKWVVARTEMDKDCVLLKPRESISLLLSSGFNPTHLEYIMFFPPRLTTKNFEVFLKWLPLGAQYVAYGFKPNNAGSDRLVPRKNVETMPVSLL